jgi:hypothetical protein
VKINLALGGFVKCPTQVNKNNWLGGFTYGDKFKVTQSGTTVTVHRLDPPSSGPPGSWGMDLSFKCCPGDPPTARPFITVLSRR